MSEEGGGEVNSLGKKYKIITDKNKKATLAKTDINTMLLKDLEQIQYISSYSIKNDKLIVNHFRDKEEI